MVHRNDAGSMLQNVALGDRELHFSGKMVITENQNEGVLVLLEPDSSVRDALTLLLEGEGWRVVLAGDCEELEAVFDNESVSAIISESSLPDCSAGQILERCKTLGLPVIFTGHDLPLQSAVDLIREGALDYLDKPFPQGRLIDLLDRLRSTQNE